VGGVNTLWWVAQKGDYSDCTVACVATVAGVSYEKALVACGGFSAKVLEEGLTLSHMRKALATLGCPSKLVRKGAYNPDTASGILHVYKGTSANQTKESHVVVLWGGRVLDGSGKFWLTATAYARESHYKMGSLVQLV